MQYDDLKIIIRTHQHTEARNHLSLPFKKNEEPSWNPLNSRNPTACFAEHQDSAEPMLKNTELDYISTHTRKSILTSTNPTTHLLDLHRNVF